MLDKMTHLLFACALKGIKESVHLIKFGSLTEVAAETLHKVVPEISK